MAEVPEIRFCFLIDITIFFKLNYFYKALIIPIMFRIWMFHIRDTAIGTLETIEEHISDGRDQFIFTVKPHMTKQVEVILKYDRPKYLSLYVIFDKKHSCIIY